MNQIKCVKAVDAKPKEGGKWSEMDTTNAQHKVKVPFFNFNKFPGLLRKNRLDFFFQNRRQANCLTSCYEKQIIMVCGFPHLYATKLFMYNDDEQKG